MPPPNRPLPPIPVPLNDYTKMLRDRPLDVFRKYSVSPPDGAVGDAMVDALGSSRRNRVLPLASRTQITTDGTFASVFKPNTNFGSEGFSHGVIGKKIAWIRLEDDTSRHGALTFQAIIPSSKATVPSGHIPVWFLPWESRFLVEMTIPQKQNEDDNDPEDPHLFFTAGINGCSVFVRGDPRSPTVTHAGISQGQTPYGNSPADFWRDLLYANLAGQNIYAGKTWEVNNTDYINQTGVSGGAQTKNTDEYLRWLKTLPSGPITVSHVVPWGCVFGIRYGRLWSFYLQENAVVHTYKIVSEYSKHTVTETKKVLGLFKKEVQTEVSKKKLVKLESTVNRPVKVRDFFPGGGNPKANFVSTWQKW